MDELLESQNRHYELSENRLILRVPQAPLFVRSALFFTASLFFIVPIVGMIIIFSSGGGLRFGYLITLGAFGLLVYYFLRMALWNTYGKEVIIFENEVIHYQAHYGWFNGNQKSIKLTDLQFYIEQIGPEVDQNGVLIITDGNEEIKCVAKMPIDDLEELIEHLTIEIQSTSSGSSTMAT